MPQLNPEFFVSQLFWLVVTFSFLLLFLWKVSLPRIGSVLEKRENKINNDIETAKPDVVVLLHPAKWYWRSKEYRC